jgi:hypothetical protein
MTDLKLLSSKVKRVVLGISLLPVMAVASLGAIVYDTTAVAELTGSRTNLAGGVDAFQFNNTAADHFTVAWVITNPVAGTWHYSYTLSGTVTRGGKNLNHFILNTANSCINVVAGTLADPKCIANITISDGSESMVPGDYTAGASNPNFPAGADILGVKFNVSGGAKLPITLTFDSDQAPVFGNFYLSVSNSTSAYNNGLGNEGTSTFSNDFIAGPGAETPEPDTAVLMLAGAGLVGLGKLLRFRPPHSTKLNLTPRAPRLTTEPSSLAYRIMLEECVG